MDLHVEVDREVCIGSGNCVYAAPGAFELDDDSVAFVVNAGAATEEQITAAARGCPSNAISVRIGAD